MRTFVFFTVLLHNIAKHQCPSVIAQSRPSDNKQFDSVRFNSSSQIAHICLRLSKGTLKRQPQIFLAHCLCARAYGERVHQIQPGPERPRGRMGCFSADLRSVSDEPDQNLIIVKETREL